MFEIISNEAEASQGAVESDPKKDKAALVSELASLMHESWRKNRKNQAGGYDTRIKPTKDEAWITANNGKTEVDIANTTFDKLPRDWAEENLASAEIALGKLNDVLYLIHDYWLDRNSDNASPEQKERYSKLPVAEKTQAIDLLDQAITVLRKHL